MTWSHRQGARHLVRDPETGLASGRNEMMLNRELSKGRGGEEEGLLPSH